MPVQGIPLPPPDSVIDCRKTPSAIEMLSPVTPPAR